MEQKTYELPFQERCLLPVNESAVPLLITLDSLALDVMIIDEQTKICFINSHYLQSYGEYWEKIGIPAKQIPGTVLLQMKNPDMAALDRLLNLIRNSLASDNYYYEDFGFSGLSDVVRIDTPSFKGAAVIQTHNDLISELSVSVAYYKDLYKQAQQQLLSKEKLPFHFQQIVGTSPQFVKILHLAARVAQTDSSVCISGESGTGKEVLAGAIHYSSQYASGPFIRVNCAAIPESLMESELFGYEKGAFTGANTNGKAGKFELANNGTLFLDEIGEMPVSMQVKLLRALQEREITRIGGSKPIKLNFRLITATNRDLEKMVADGTFREDIYYRICIIPLQLPPLRDRRTDIPLLSDMFLSSLDMPQWENRHFSTDVSDHFLRYSWPGNIRELKNCVERMAILCPTEEISADYLPANIISSLAETDKNAATPPPIRGELQLKGPDRKNRIRRHQIRFIPDRWKQSQSHQNPWYFKTEFLYETRKISSEIKDKNKKEDRLLIFFFIFYPFFGIFFILSFPNYTDCFLSLTPVQLLFTPLFCTDFFCCILGKQLYLKLNLKYGDIKNMIRSWRRPGAVRAFEDIPVLKLLIIYRALRKSHFFPQGQLVIILYRPDILRL